MLPTQNLGPTTGITTGMEIGVGVLLLLLLNPGCTEVSRRNFTANTHRALAAWPFVLFANRETVDVLPVS